MGSATIMQLSQGVLGELQRLGYAGQTIAVYRRLYARLLRFAEANGTEQYSEELCSRWLKESLGIDATRVVAGTDPVYRRKNCQPIRVCQCLTEWQLHGCLALKKQGKLAALPVPRGFRKAYDSYVAFCRDAGYSQQGVYTRLNRIKRMLLFFDQHEVSDIRTISAQDISAFLKSQIELDSRTVASMLVAYRAFFHHLKRTGLIIDDLAEKLPTIKANRQFRLPRVWRREDVLAVLNSIDRGSPVGKRDYAVLLLITRYGLRSLDVRTLKLSSLHWNENFIEIVQSKTGEPMRLPLLQDVGWAIIDYLRNGRPPSPLPEVFLTSTVPFRPFGVHSCGLNAILAKRVRQAGVAFPPDVPKGVHALRHTLASLMLAQGVELPVISAVLGHLSSESTGVYLHTVSGHKHEVAPNVVNREFDPERPNQIWASDATYIATAEGWLYLFVIIDLYSRRVVGWAMSKSLGTATLLQAFWMAVARRGAPEGLIFHSDRGVQYASTRFRNVLRSKRFIQSMSRKGNC